MRRPRTHSLAQALVVLLLCGASGCDSVSAAPVAEQRASAARARGCPRGQTHRRPRTRPPRSRILSDHAAACHVRLSAFEPRPRNERANLTVPTPTDLLLFRAASPDPYRYLVTGDYRGTTDEILQWAAWKWGINPDILRAVASVESWWRQSSVEDNGQTFGIMSIKRTVHPGTWPLSKVSTAFNVDYYGSLFRTWYDGYNTWAGRRYHAGDLWGSIGAHFGGNWWSRADRRYVAKVKRALRIKPWLSSDF